MAGYTSTQTGNWSAQATWGGSGPPGDGDTATISTGHVVTATADVIIGTSPADQTTNVLVVNGQLIINTGVNFTIRGNWSQSGTTGSNGLINCAGNLKIDGTTSSIKYIGGIGAQNSTTALLKLSGSAGARASFASLGSGTTNAYTVNGGWTSGGRIEWDYADVTNIGDATNNAASPWVYNNVNLYLRNCKIDSCGKIDLIILSTTNTYVNVQNSIWSNSRNGTCFATTSNVGGNSRLYDNNRFDKYVTFYPSTGATITNNHFDGNVGLTGYTAASWGNNLVNIGGGDGVIPTTVSGDYVYDSASNINPHPTNLNLSANINISDMVYDFPSGAVGDFIVGGPGSGSYTLSAKRCLSVPNSAGTSSGELISPIRSGFTYTVEHNTITSTAFPVSNAESGVAVYGETYAGVAGMYASLRSNYVYSPTGKGAFLARHVTGTVSNVLASPSAADYNAGNAIVNATGSGVQAIYGAIGGYADVVGTVTNPMFTWTNGGTPDLAQLGAHDLVANANFVDPTRNLATFDTAYLGNTATAWSGSSVSYNVGDIVSTASSGFYNNATINFRCIAAHTSASGNATNGQPGATGTTSWRSRWELASVYRIRTSSAVYSAGTRQATPKDLWTWVRGGFVPTNAVIKGAAHDSSDIGAMLALGTNQVHGDFFARSNTSAGGAGSSNVTGPGTPYTFSNYVDIDGCGAAISSNSLSLPYGGTLAAFEHAGLVTPPSVRVKNGTAKVRYVYQGASAHSVAIHARQQQDGLNGYFSYIYGGQLNIKATVAGNTSGALATGSVTAPSTNDVLRLELKLENGTTSGTKLTASLYNETQSNSLIATATVDNDATMTAYQVGGVGVSSYTTTSVIKSIELYSDSSVPSIYSATTSGNVSTSQSMTLYGIGTAWTSSTTFSVAGGTGASISGLSVNTTTQVATFTLTNGSAAGTLTISNNTDAATLTFTAINPAVTISALTLTENDPAGIGFSWTKSGGTGTVTSSVYRHTSAPFTPPGTGTLLQSGISGTSYVDTTATLFESYFYRVLGTDGTTTGLSTQDSNNTSLFVVQKQTKRVVAAIGDSITAGYGASGTNPLIWTWGQLALDPTWLVDTSSGLNQGVNGTSTVDWVNNTNGANLATACSAISALGADTLIIALGMNDIKSGVATSQSALTANLVTIGTYAYANIPTLKRIYIAEMTYPTPGYSAGLWTEANVATAVNEYRQAYSDAASTLTNAAVIGRYVCELFQQNASTWLLSNDLHPNATGSRWLGERWGSDILLLEASLSVSRVLSNLMFRFDTSLMFQSRFGSSHSTVL